MASFTSYLLAFLVFSHVLTVFVSFEINSNFKNLMLEQVQKELHAYTQKIVLARDGLRDAKSGLMKEVRDTNDVLIREVTDFVANSQFSTKEVWRLRAELDQLTEQIATMAKSMEETWEKELKTKAKAIAEARQMPSLAMPEISDEAKEVVKRAKEKWMKEPSSNCPEGHWEENVWITSEVCSRYYTNDWPKDRIEKCKEELENHWIVLAGDENMRTLHENLAKKMDLFEGSSLATEPLSDRERFDSKLRLSLRFVPFMETGSESYRKAKNLVTQPTFAKLYTNGAWTLAHDLSYFKDYHKPDIVFMNTGIWELNNVSQEDWDRFWEPVFAQRFLDLLKLVKENKAFTRFVWVTIPQFDQETISEANKRFYLPDRIRYLNALERHLVQDAGFEVLDLERMSMSRKQDLAGGMNLQGDLLNALSNAVLSYSCKKD